MQNSSMTFLRRLEAKHDQYLRHVEQFNTALTHLQYEGLPRRKHNIQRVEKMTRILEKDLLPHMTEDRDIVFPFLAKHVPRLEPVMGVFNGEHDEFLESFEQFKTILSNLHSYDAQPQADQLLTNLHVKGTYLYCLIRNHLYAEHECVVKVISRELQPRELKELEILLKN